VKPAQTRPLAIVSLELARHHPERDYYDTVTDQFSCS